MTILNNKKGLSIHTVVENIVLIVLTFIRKINKNFTELQQVSKTTLKTQVTNLQPKV